MTSLLSSMGSLRVNPNDMIRMFAQVAKHTATYHLSNVRSVIKNIVFIKDLFVVLGLLNW